MEKAGITDSMIQEGKSAWVTSEASVLMTPIAVVWERHIFMGRITVIAEDGGSSW